MNNPLKKYLLTILILIVCYDSVELGRRLLPKIAAPKIEERYVNRSLGDPRAPLWVIEYTDFECQGCAILAGVMREKMAAEPGKIYLQARYFPIRSHRLGLLSALYAEGAARQKKYWCFAEKMFASQEEWLNAPDPEAVYQRLASECGVDIARLKKDVRDPAVKEAILKEKEEARSLGVDQTPTFFIDGKKVEGLEPIRLELAKSK